jgi:hypothetical protein
MTAVLWDPDDEPIQLGGTFQCYTAWAEWQHVAGEERFAQDWPALGGLMTQIEWQEPADPEWFEDLQTEAQNFLEMHGGELTDLAYATLKVIADA